MKNIFSVISKVDFNEIEESDKIIELLQDITKNIIKSHSTEKETILILQNINSTTFSFEEIFSILKLITNCPILVKLCNLYNEQNKEVCVDYNYELEQKEKVIEKLNQENKIIHKLFPNGKIPIDIEFDIFQACKAGDLNSVKWLIEENHVNPNSRISESTYPLFDKKSNFTPLIFACLNNSLPIVEYLLQKGANVHAKDAYKRTALHYACIEGNLPIVKDLWRYSAYLEVKDKKGNTPIFYAVEKGNLPIIDFLNNGMINYLHKANLSAKNNLNETLLHIACSSGHFQIVQYLISYGANINAKTIYGKTPLDYAKEKGHSEIVKYIISLTEQTETNQI